MGCRFSCLCAILGLTLCNILPAAEIAREWTVFGPYYRLLHRLPDGLDQSIPEKLKVGSQTQTAVTATPEDGKLDIGAALGGNTSHKSFYICIPIHAIQAEQLKIGAGADWWMDLYLNGKSVGDTLADGNVAWPPTASDHLFTLDLQAGDNLLVVGVIGGTGTQQLVLKPNPVFPPGYPLVSKMQFGTNRMPSLEKIGSEWENGAGDHQFQPGKEFSLEKGLLKLTPKPGGRKYFAAKLHLEPGRQYCLAWSGWTSAGQTPTLLIQDRADGGTVYFAKELTSGRNRRGYFYAENPEPYAILEMRGVSVTEISALSLRQRIDRSAAFQDWTHQRFPAPDTLVKPSHLVSTPHFDFAPKLPGAPLKVFAVTSFWRQMLRNELEERFDFITDGMFTNG
ncbi:MAG: hypothetical protein IJJ33_17495, partial [Victivallales bacterium]|nr:hypothetical protein [Victivallales bacterium]